MTPTTITLTGNLTRDPEIKAGANGQFVCKLKVAANRRVVNRTAPQERTDVVSYYDVVAFGALAENVGSSLQRGMRIVVTGRLDQQCWRDAQDKKHYGYEIIADEVGASLRFATAAIQRAVRRGPLVVDAQSGDERSGEEQSGDEQCSEINEAHANADEVMVEAFEITDGMADDEASWMTSVSAPFGLLGVDVESRGEGSAYEVRSVAVESTDVGSAEVGTVDVGPNENGLAATRRRGSPRVLVGAAEPF